MEEGSEERRKEGGNEGRKEGKKEENELNYPFHAVVIQIEAS